VTMKGTLVGFERSGDWTVSRTVAGGLVGR